MVTVILAWTHRSRKRRFRRPAPVWSDPRPPGRELNAYTHMNSAVSSEIMIADGPSVEVGFTGDVWHTMAGSAWHRVGHEGAFPEAMPVGPQ